MQAIQCSKGHFYDQSQGECPKCAEEARRSACSFIEVPDYIPATAPASMSATLPIDEPLGGTVPVTRPGFSPTDFVTKPNNAGGWQVDDYGETQPCPVTDVEGFDPIVGWLVCVKGPNRGKDYRLHSGTNYIGSHKDMDVCIDNDRTISREKAASISYDDRGQVFFIQRGEGRNLVYLNGKAVRSDADLNSYDRILIGATELVFVPLCSEQFKWQEV